ncbi:hypothetical protein [Paracholeplasma manati]|uniref:Uncharacterized protein n=1 Tax=Paracholeplasma manati TaxID=591373 RepID=A0ABT2Y630_9MOLU|nr:hypothetical protein [Paracholeplasma manati]MCV2231913.1 hypothetical protein [Paracholeplasma manati]MDG0889161.1 hypothetical protein [Paracholeplasma manati]
MFSFGQLIVVLFNLIFLLLIPVTLVGVKVLILRYFEFSYSKKTLLHYFVMYLILTIIVLITSFLLSESMGIRGVVSIIHLPLLLVAIIYEFVVIHKLEFEYEPKGPFAFMMVITHVADGMVLSAMVGLYLVLIFLVGFLVNI